MRVSLRIILVSIFFGFFAGICLAQPDSLGEEKPFLPRMAQKIFGSEHAPGKPQFLVYPTLGYAPETSWEIGASALALFYAKGDYKHNRLSEVKAFTFFTTRRQYGLWVDHSIYGDQDNWFFLGAIRQQRFPLLFFGIGPDTEGDDPILINANYTLIRERVLRKIRKNLFIGLEVDFQRLYKAEFERPPFPRPLGAEGTSNMGIGLGLVYDNRSNVLNERSGLFAEVALLDYHSRWGSTFHFRGVYWDVRKFFPMNRDSSQVLAVQAAGAFLSGDVPFNQLALLGGDMLMRGYYLGRYRDKNYVGVQAEYRFLPFPFSKRLGAAVFMGYGGVTPEVGAFNLKHFRPAGGAGLRFLLFPQKDIYVRLDVGITPEGTGIYFFTGEAF